MSSINLAQRAYEGKLTVEEVNRATKKKLEEKSEEQYGFTVLYWASNRGPIEVAEAILDKGVSIDGLSFVSFVVVYWMMIIKLTFITD
jgi:hypothetical protein